MKPSLSDVLPLLNANCGDVLKVALLHEFFPTLPKINPMWLKAPTGNIEAAFAALQAAKEPVTRADAVLSEFKQDAVQRASRPVKEERESKYIDPKIQAIVRENTTARTLADMPAGVRFEDSERTASEAAEITHQETGRTMSAEPIDVVVPDMITLEEAATKFGYSYAGLLNRLKSSGVKGGTVKGRGRALFFQLSEVSAVCANKGRHIK